MHQVGVVWGQISVIMYDWKVSGAKKENGYIEIKLTHQHFEPIVFDSLEV